MRLNELTEKQIEKIVTSFHSALPMMFSERITVEVSSFSDDHDRAGEALVLVRSSTGIVGQYDVQNDDGELSFRAV